MEPDTAAKKDGGKHAQWGTYNTEGLSLYELLGVPVDASDLVVEKGYRKTALRFHPDKNSDPRAIVVFDLVREAHEVLTDSGTRKEYDRKMEARLQSELRNRERTAAVRAQRERLQVQEDLARRRREEAETLRKMPATRDTQLSDIAELISRRKRKRVESAAEMEAALRRSDEDAATAAAAGKPAVAAAAERQQQQRSVVEDAFAFFDATPPAHQVNLAELEARLEATA